MGRALTVDWRPAGPANPEEKLFQAPGGQTGELLYCNEREVLLEGPSRTGKTVVIVEKLHYFATAFPGLRGVMLRQTRRSLTHSVMTTYEDEVLPFKSGVRFKHEPQSYEYPNGSRLVVGGLDDPEKILSTGWDIIYVNQAEETYWDAYQKLLSRLSGSAMPFRQIILDVNPSDPQHWINQYFPPQGPAVNGRRRLVSKHQDNPRLYDQQKQMWTDFGREYLQTLESLTGATYQRLRLGLWVSAEGQFFTEWDPDIHICKPFDVPKDWPRWLAVDYGFADPFCCLFAARDPATKRIYIYRELYGSGLRDEQQARLVAKAMQGERIVRLAADPSMFNQRKEQGKPSIARIYWNNGVRIRPASNRRIDGWQTVRRALAHDDGPPRLQVMDGRAPNLVRTLPAMVCDPFDPEDLADKIGSQKTEDHACLVGETLVGTPTGPRRLDSLAVGDDVWTRQGIQRVTDWARTRANADVLTVHLSNGQRLTGTGTHPVFVEGRGFTPIDGLRYADVVGTMCQELVLTEASCAGRRSCSAESGSTVTRSPNDAAMPFTTDQTPLILVGALATSIRKSGRRLMALFQRAVTSITGTKTRRTMMSTTLNACLSLTIYPCMGENLPQPPSSLPLIGHVPLLPNGISHPRGGHGTANIANSSGRLGNRQGTRATNAVGNTGQKTGPVIASAQITASQPGAEKPNSTSWNASAPSARPPSDATNTYLPRRVAVNVAMPISVLKVTSAGKAPVYNITVQNAHEYYAQGVLVSNCDTLRYLCVSEATAMPTRQIQEVRFG